MSLDSAFKAFVGAVAGKHFAEPEQFLTATVTEYAPPGIGTGAQVTVSVGGNDGVILPYTLQDRIGVGDRLKVRTGRDQINRTYEVVSKDFTTDVAGQYIPGHRSPVVLVDGLANLPGASTPGGYHAAASVRYQSVRRGQYDLFGQGWNRMRVRYRQTDPTFFIIDGPNVTSWIDPGSFLPHPSATILTTLLAGITALSTSLLLAANLDIPPNPTGADGGSVRLLVDNEIVSGDYTAATGVVSNLSRGVEPLPGDTTTNANSHSIGAPVTLLTAAIDIPTLATGTPYYVQIAPAREDGTIGIYVPSVPIAFTSWEQAQPAADVAGLLMNQTRAALDARWQRSLADINGHPMHDLRGYNVIRSVDPSTSAGWDAATKTTPSDQLPASWTNLVDGPIDGTTIVATNQVLWPIARGTGNWIGVRAMRNAGPVSPHWVWTLDNTPPPAPTGVTFTSVPNGIAVKVDPLVDTAWGDPGFKEYVLYTNAAGSGTTGTEVARAQSQDFTYEVHNLSSQTYYQLASADWAGNVSVLLTGGWQYVASLYPTNDFPQNGNFQDPGYQDTGLAIVESPRWWELRFSTLFGTVGYDTGVGSGMNGNRSIYQTIPANVDPAVHSVVSVAVSQKQVVPSTAIPTLEMWVKSDQTLSAAGGGHLDRRPMFEAGLFGYQYDDGSVATSFYFGNSAQIALTAGVWTKVSFPISTPYSVNSNTRVVQLDIGLYFAAPLPSPMDNPAFRIDYDAVRIVFS